MKGKPKVKDIYGEKNNTVIGNISRYQLIPSKAAITKAIELENWKEAPSPSTSCYMG